jgi:16S rRNA (guanine966-N2)-methyltransferase
VRTYLEGLVAGSEDAPTLVFSDPPYDLSDAAVQQDLEALARVTAPGAVVVLERSSRTAPPVWPAGLEPDRARRYGDTMLHLATRVDPEHA